MDMTQADRLAADGPGRRVLLVNRVSFLGGVERIVLTLAAGLPSCGWTPVLASPSDGELPDAAWAQGTQVAACRFDRMRITANPRELARYPLALLHGSWDLERCCRTHKIDVLHVHHPVTALQASLASRRLAIPLILHVHETLPVRPLYALALRLALRRATIVLCVSQAALRLALALGSDPAQSRVVYNGLDRYFVDSPRQSGAVKPLHMSTGPHIGVFGVMEPRKGQHLFLEAAALLTDRFPTARFWIVGPAALKDKQAYVERLHRLAKASPLRGRIEFAGFQSDMLSWLAAMDIVVQPSVVLESFGMAVAEAMALGRPVVVTQVGGLPEVVHNEQTGLIVPPHDPPALAAALARLLGDPTLRAHLGAQAAREARSRFSPQAFCQAVVDTYDATLQLRRRSSATPCGGTDSPNCPQTSRHNLFRSN
jgi:glycosyltransferase involved in cell wall biosynthesis